MSIKWRVAINYAALILIASLAAPVSAQQCMPCQADCNGDNRISIGELISAVGDALRGCGNDALALGESLYREPHEDGNTFACATCHALSEPARDGLIRAGHPIGGAPLRPHWKDAQLSAFLDAVNTCRVDWLAAPAFSADDERFLALEEFLTAQTDATFVEPLSYSIVDPPENVSGGDPVAGEETFNRRCITCHGESGVGSERAPAIAGTTLSGEFIATRIRRSGNPNSSVYPDLIAGRMPFWSASRISDEQLRDVVAFLLMSEPEVNPGENTGDDRFDFSLAGAQDGCASTHPKVGQTMTFRTIAHRVAGMATIVDDCTIHFDDFSFDGGGIDVHVYGGTAGNYRGGVDLSTNLFGESFDEGSAVLRLPQNVTLDDFDGLSIWCVPVRFSFGDGLFG